MSEKKSLAAPLGIKKVAPVASLPVKLRLDTATPPIVIPSPLKPLKYPLATTLSPATPDDGLKPLDAGFL